MKLLAVDHERVGNFSDPMTVARCGLLELRSWHLGRLGFLRLGVKTPLGLAAVALHQQPDGHLPMQHVTTHCTVLLGRANARLW